MICSTRAARSARAVFLIPVAVVLACAWLSAEARGLGPSPASWPDVPIGSISPEVFSLALGAVDCAARAGTLTSPVRTLTVIDYSRPSTDERLWVYDLERHALVYQERVAHGQGSGGNLATSFSNAPGSHKSSLGLFRTAETYVGSNGYSLRLDGLEPGINDRARERAIVMHGADYVGEQAIRAWGRLGRSWGCPAVRPEVARELLDGVKGGGLLFAYYPDEDYLATSTYLGACAAAHPATR